MTEKDQSKFHFANALKQSIIQFFGDTTLHGYKYLVDPKRDNFLERLAWFVVVLVALVFAVYISLLGWSQFNENPTFTTLYSQKYPIWEVDFPGVSICSINRISRKAANKYAEQLLVWKRRKENKSKKLLFEGVEIVAKATNHPRKHNFYFYSRDKRIIFHDKATESIVRGSLKDSTINISWTLDSIRRLGALTDYSSNALDSDFFQFQQLLDRLDPDEEYEGVNDIRKTMQMLTPQCSDLLVKCRWENRDLDCNKIVAMRRTIEGYCCTFNYVRATGGQTIEKLRRTAEPIRGYQTGIEKGLIIVLNTTTSDYFYSLHSTIGFVVGIHNPRNFPDATNGNYHQFIVPQNTEAFFKLDVSTIQTDTDVMRYSLDKRGCLFNFENEGKFGGHYSYADCILRCKIYSYLHLCDCIPYVLPINFPDFGAEMRNATRCNLTHLKCLARYATTVITRRPKKLIEGLEKEMGDSIDCPECYPLCSLSRYSVQATYSEISAEEIMDPSWGIMKGVVTDKFKKDVSIVRVYYPVVATLLYKSGVVFTWHEIISYFGGLLSLCIGFSTISVMEVVYFATVRLYQNFMVSFGNKNKIQIKQRKQHSYKEMEIILVKEYVHHKK